MLIALLDALKELQDNDLSGMGKGQHFSAIAWIFRLRSISQHQSRLRLGKMNVSDLDWKAYQDLTSLSPECG